MKATQHFLLLFIACIICAGSVSAQTAGSAGSNTYAIVVGISGYQNPAIPRLMYADKDATLFADWLQSKAGGSVPGYHVKLFTNENATIANIYTALDWLKTQAKKDDLVYIYFSGHGDIETRDTISQGYLLAWNSPSNNYRNNAISVADINEQANLLTTRNNAKVIIITDACHSGKMAGDFYKGRQLTAANLQLVLNNQVRLASCAADQQAAEGPGWGAGRGVFSYYLLMGLQGMAAANSNGVIQLKSLETFLDTSFKKDDGLAIEKHQQQPVIDGSPLFAMAMVDTATLRGVHAAAKINGVIKPTAAGLQSLKTLGQQPIDYFFAIAQTSEIDTVLHFKNYSYSAVGNIPAAMVGDYIKHLQKLQRQHDSLLTEEALLDRRRDSIFDNTNRKDTIKWELAMHEADSLHTLKETNKYLGLLVKEKMKNKDTIILGSLEKQLKSNPYILTRFIEKFVQLTHAKSQEMINAYLNGDLAELERRQYYYAGNRQYSAFLSVLDLAIHLAPETNYLSSILKINRSYIAGLINRLEMSRSTQRDSLLQSAFVNQRAAIKKEPYAAYIHNELGNLFLQQQVFDSAAYYYNYALTLSPAWAVPWSNKIRLNLALNNLAGAKTAIRAADSLQPNLAYVNVNAGLVMEKDSNWLAAEAYYLNAIAQNNVHYLPFERLGFVYIHTGRYALADSFFIEAKSRKDAFAVNELSFRFGIEQSVKISMNNAEDKKVHCDSATVEQVSAWKPLTDLEKTFAGLVLHKPQNVPAEQKLKTAILELPQFPLTHHYLGRQYFLDSNWILSENYLKEAIRRYLSNDALEKSLKIQLNTLLQKSKLDTSAIYADSSCLVAIFMNYQYDKAEDYYMLAKLYEKLERWDEAISQYLLIAEIENELQMEQDIYKGFTKNSVTDDQSMLQKVQQIRRYEKPVKMGGTIKAARMLEAMAKYDAAEAVLLKQVARNRKSGDARQEAINNKIFGPLGKRSLNNFWLDINYDLEAETYNFYNRMLAQFPRDANWYRKAGLFLYNRLVLSYSRIPKYEQPLFYNYSLSKAYPYTGNAKIPGEGLQVDFLKNINAFKLPVTGEEIIIDMDVYDPLKASLTYLIQAEKLSGEISADPLIVEAMANLQQWMGNADIALEGYHLLMQLVPNNTRLRNAYIDLLIYHNRLPVAASELDSLHKKGALTHEQTLRLAYYKVLNKQGKESMVLLDKYIPRTIEEKNMKAGIYMQQFLNAGQFKKALQLANDSLQQGAPKTAEFAEDAGLKKFGFDNFQYTKLRMYAMIKMDSKALELMRKLLDAGFTNIQVVNNDPALTELRKTKKWKRMWNLYDFTTLNNGLDNRMKLINYNPFAYRIPGTKLDSDQ